MTSLLALYVLEPVFTTLAELGAPQNQRVLRFLPSYWFLGLFQQLNGSREPAFASLAHHAAFACSVSVVTAASLLLLFYLRLLPKIVEEPDIRPSGRRSSLPALLTGDTLGAAVSNFALRTVLRSRQHRMLLSVYFGIGMAIAMAYARSAGDVEPGSEASPGLPAMVASLLFLVLAVMGLRVVAALPVALPANWIMRVTQRRAVAEYRQAVRRCFVLLAVCPVWLAAAVWFAVHGPGGPVAVHLAVLGLVGLLLVEVCLRSFPKVPFTCSYQPGRGNLHLVFWVGLFLVLRLLVASAVWERDVLRSASGSAFLLGGLVVAVLLTRWWNERGGGHPEELRFDERSEAELLGLHLGSQRVESGPQLVKERVAH